MLMRHHSGPVFLPLADTANSMRRIAAALDGRDRPQPDNQVSAAAAATVIVCFQGERQPAR
jgi:hypothetical protein